MVVELFSSLLEEFGAESISGAAKRGLADLYMPRLIKNGYTASSAYNSVKGTALGFRKKEFLDKWRSYKGVAVKADHYKNVPKKYRLPLQAFERSPKKINKEYRWIVKTTYTEPETGKEIKDFYTFESDERLPDSTVEDGLGYAFRKYPDANLLLGGSFDVVQRWRRK